MKKLITLAVSAALVAPLAAFAETTLYGRLDTALDYIDPDDEITASLDQNGDVVTVTGVGETCGDGDSCWDVNTNTTRVGIKGSEDLGNGLKAIFQAEWAFSSSEGGSTADGLRNRLAYAGLSGGFGTAAIGRQWTPYYGAVDKTDIFNKAADVYYLGTYRTGNAVAYVTPNFNGFQGKAALVLDEGNTAKDNIDHFQLTAEYNNGPISVGVGYLKSYGATVQTAAVPAGFEIDQTTGLIVATPAVAASSVDVEDTTTWGIGASYNFGMFKLIAQYEDSETPDVFDVTDSMDWRSWAVAGEGYFGNHTLRAMFGNLDYDYDDDNSWAVGYQYNFSKRTRAYLEYSDRAGVSRDNNAGTITVGESDVLTMGFRHDF
ncbi:MAG: porin [Gammaproteobacteria bacterium]|nr:porin [Gammaproteobacteria bacterium]